RDKLVTGVQTCALPILGVGEAEPNRRVVAHAAMAELPHAQLSRQAPQDAAERQVERGRAASERLELEVQRRGDLHALTRERPSQIGRASCREREGMSVA